MFNPVWGTNVPHAVWCGQKNILKILRNKEEETYSIQVHKEK